MLRLFTAFALPDEMTARLSRMQGGIHGARWIPRANFHVTLTFIGEVTEETAEDIDAALQTIRAPAPVLRFDGFDAFAQGDDAKVLYLSVAADPALVHVKEKIDAALQSRGLPYAARRYVPHVTLARFRHAPDDAALASFCRDHADAGFSPVRPEFFSLYLSRQGRHGVAYEALADYPLAA